MSPHLSEEQFAECAVSGGDMPAQVSAHLQACAVCREEWTAFQASVESFNEVSMQWSESRPAESLRPRVRADKAQPRWAMVSWALAGCLAVASAVSVGTHYEGQRNAARSSVQESAAVDGEISDAQTSEAQVSEAQIERDNKLLLAVDQATSARPVSPLLEYGIDEPAATRGKGRSSRTAND